MLEKKFYWLIGIGVATLSLIALLIGVGVVLGNEIDFNNLMAYIGFSLLVGFIVYLSLYFNFTIVQLFFGIGLLIGFIEMYRIFLDEMSGWGDLIGLLSLFTITLLGLGIGIISQFGLYLYRKFTKN